MAGLTGKARDLHIGRTNEIEMLPKIRERFGSTIVRSSFEKASMDYHSADKKTYVEIKKRNIRSNQYKTIFVNKCKINFCRAVTEADPTVECYFTYRLLDGDYYVKYEPELFETFESGEFMNDCADDNIQIVTDIPTELLKAF